MGNTISAMQRSSTNLSTALKSVSKAMRGDENEEQDGQSIDGRSTGKRKQLTKEEEDQLQAQKTVNYVASLLLILQEAPDEIWRLLDLASSYQTTSHDDNHSPSDQTLARSKANLKSARRLSLASSLFILLKTAGQQMQALPDQVKSLFPHPLWNHHTVLGSIETELKSSLTDIIALSSVTLSASQLQPEHKTHPVTQAFQPSLEASYRASVLALVSLIQLDVVPSSDAPTFFLQQRRRVLEAWADEQCKGTTSASQAHRGDASLSSILRSCYEEFTEVSILHDRIFSPDEGGKSTLSNVLDAFADAETAGTSQHNGISSIQSLVPSTSLATVASLPSSEQVIVSLQEDTPLRQALRAAAISLQQTGRAAATIELHFENEYCAPFRELFLRQWTPAVLKAASHSSQVGRARRQIAQAHAASVTLVSRILHGQQNINAIHDQLAALATDIKLLLDEQATLIFSKRVDQWRLDAVTALQDALRAVAARDDETYNMNAFAQLLLPSRSDTQQQFSRKQLDPAMEVRNALQGNHPQSPLYPFLQSVSKGWQDLQSSKERYLKYLNNQEEEKDKSSSSTLQRTWKSKELQSGWESVFAEIRAMLKTAMLSSQVAHGQDHYHQRFERVLLLSDAVRTLCTHQQYTNLMRSCVDDEAIVESLQRGILQARQDALQPWRSYIVDQAEASWIGDTTTTTNLVQALAFIDQKSHETNGFGISAASNSQSVQDLLDMGSFADLVAALVLQVNGKERLPPSQDLDVLAYILRACGKAKSNDLVTSALAIIDQRRPSQLDEAAIAEHLQPYRLFLGQCPAGAIPYKHKDSEAAPPVSTSAVRPLFELAKSPRRLKGVAVR